MQPRRRLAFAGACAVRLKARGRARLHMPCDVLRADEVESVARLPAVDVLVTMAFTPEMGAAGRRLTRVQVPGAGFDRLDRSALPTDTWLANANGHKIGIAEYVMGAMLTLTCNFTRLDTCLRQGHWESQGAVSTSPPAPPGPQLRRTL
jgi:phosphoglycerate dehydrogenase-like enzyme